MITMSKKHPTVTWLGMFLTMIVICLLSACSNSSVPSQTSGIGTGNTLATKDTIITPGTTNVGSVSFIGIRMLDKSNGWALTTSSILKTSDGGIHWKNVTPANTVLSQMARGDFLSEKYAWIVNASQDNTISVLRTSDGGQSWQSATIADPNSEIVDVPHFLNTQEGWLEVTPGGPGAGSEGVDIFHTIDGGKTWNKIASSGQSASGLPNGGLKSGISFKDAKNGWATGGDATPNSVWLYATHDGGQTWQKVTSSSFYHLPDWGTTQNTSYSYHTTSPVFFGNDGFLPIQINGQLDNNTRVSGFIIYHTANGGQGWAPPAPGIDALAKFMTDDLYMVDPQHAWASDTNSGACYATADAGKTWQIVADVGQVRAFSFVDASYGWAIGDQTLQHTTDGGKTWQKLTYSIQ